MWHIAELLNNTPPTATVLTAFYEPRIGSCRYIRILAEMQMNASQLMRHEANSILIRYLVNETYEALGSI